MNAPPFPLNPSVGESHGNWVWNGVRWVCAPTTGVQVNTIVFTASGPYMPSPGLVSVTVECIGGGGAGAQAGPTTINTEIFGGGGGGSGAYARKTLPAALVAGGVAVTVGGGGDPTGINQGAGGATSFGALCVASGGLMGEQGAVNFSGAGGWGGPPTTCAGDLIMPGGAGRAGTMQVTTAQTNWFLGYGGVGGQMWGGTVFSDIAGPGETSPGYPVYANTGAGGTGGIVNQVVTATPVLGSAGGSGVCIVTEYCWASATDGDCMNPPVNVNARVALTQAPCWPGPGPCPPGWSGGPYEGGGYEE